MKGDQESQVNGKEGLRGFYQLVLSMNYYLKAEG